jgi:spoIIIJ-associated protein
MRGADLVKYSGEVAGRVLESGNEVALEPMPPADRKVVHDTVSAIDGVTTASEGEEPRRRVVIRPA